MTARPVCVVRWCCCWCRLTGSANVCVVFPARYFNTTERMEDLFGKVCGQMINACKAYVLSVQAEETGNRLWDKDPLQLITHLEACLKLNTAFQEQYRLTKERLESTPKGKQFDFNERNIFGKFDLFCRRCVKLIDLFSTIHQVRVVSVACCDWLIQGFAAGPLVHCVSAGICSV